MDENKVRETIEDFKKLAELLQNKESSAVKHCNTAIEALEKQLPKKPRENGMYDGLIKKIKYYTCPTCGNCLLTEMMNERQNTSYCWDCGQKLDWSE
ncbi:MAG: hypothetical protein UDA86_03475 [Blautia sp.]|nr:hypothetical protein [Blautia sp.]